MYSYEGPTNMGFFWANADTDTREQENFDIWNIGPS